MQSRKQQIMLILSMLFFIAAADQITKTLLMQSIPHGSVTWEGKDTTFFFLVHERNPGLLGGMFRDSSVIKYTLNIAAMGVLVYLFRFLNRDSRVQAIAYGLVAGGAIGNGIDRLRLGSVTDFLQVYFYFIPFDFPWKRYPAFNVADAAITVGVITLIITWHYFDQPKETDAADSV